MHPRDCLWASPIGFVPLLDTSRDQPSQTRIIICLPAAPHTHRHVSDGMLGGSTRAEPTFESPWVRYKQKPLTRQPSDRPLRTPARRRPPPPRAERKRHRNQITAPTGDLEEPPSNIRCRESDEAHPPAATS